MAIRIGNHGDIAPVFLAWLIDRRCTCLNAVSKHTMNLVLAGDFQGEQALAPTIRRETVRADYPFKPASRYEHQARFCTESELKRLRHAILIRLPDQPETKRIEIKIVGDPSAVDGKTYRNSWCH
ncbi:hypothetical protein A3840_08045 [Devosia elaeis]|uniref:Uncharacterized protein n=1 Tax=Devosia elaeis TaxID=1770058 RepID=A0A178I0Q6_9HYPH|nr:hypothetical protein A3840_08045 [Devosia elaeis]